MRKIAIVLSVFTLTVNSCGQPTKQQSKEKLNSIDTLSVVVNNSEMPKLSKSTENKLFRIQKIDSTSYFSAKEKSNIPPKADLNKITDLAQAKKILKEQVVWGRYDEETYKMVEDEQGESVHKVIFRNGKIILYDYPEVYFIAYFPQEDILFLEGGHTSDIIFNLTTGAETEEVVGYKN